jgi:hypothetical protein
MSDRQTERDAEVTPSTLPDIYHYATRRSAQDIHCLAAGSVASLLLHTLPNTKLPLLTRRCLLSLSLYLQSLTHRCSRHINMVSLRSAAASLLGSVLVLALVGCASAGNFGSWQTGRATFYGEQQADDRSCLAAAGPATARFDTGWLG